MADEAARKTAYFCELFALSLPSDEEDDDLDVVPSTIPTSSPCHLSRTTSTLAVAHARTSSDPRRQHAGFKHSCSDPGRLYSRSKSKEDGETKRQAGNVQKSVEIEKPAVEPIRNTPSIKQQTSHRQELNPRRTVPDSLLSKVPAPPSAVVRTDSTGKRKREQKIKKLPENQQYFRGLTFFYVPNDDVGALRRERIRIARERGARWATEWDDEITHVIVDNNLTYSRVVAYLKVDDFPPGVIVVDIAYQLDCMVFRTILDPNQEKYHVKGRPNEQKERQSLTAVSQSSDRSLQLKAPQSKPGKWDYVPPRGTPPRSEDSSPREAAVVDQALYLGSSSEVQLATTGPDRSTLPAMTRYPPSKSLGFKQDVPSKQPLLDGDALDETIQNASAYQDLVLDDDSDEDVSSSQTPCESEGEDEPDEPARKKMTVQKKQPQSEESFSCRIGGSNSSKIANPNIRTIEMFQELADYYSATSVPQDRWRVFSYRRAVTILKRQKHRISTYDEAIALAGIGERLANKIIKVATTNRLRRLESALAEPADKILRLFMNIYGVGSVQASYWVKQGYKTLEELTRHVQLTENQRLGIEHYDDFATRIPRPEVAALGDIVKQAGAVIDPDVEIVIGGSYRRGAESSGDIDFIVTKPKTTTTRQIMPFLNKLVSELTRAKFLVAPLAVPSRETGSKWHGCCALPGTQKPVWRRIDFLLVPESELGAALIYFTGNDIFNRSIRLLANKKGMRLNQRGLYRGTAAAKVGKRLEEGRLIEGRSEEKIMEILGVKWRPPHERNC